MPSGSQMRLHGSGAHQGGIDGGDNDDNGDDYGDGDGSGGGGGDNENNGNDDNAFPSFSMVASMTQVSRAQSSEDYPQASSFKKKIEFGFSVFSLFTTIIF